jgi:hypothetical protein
MNGKRILYIVFILSIVLMAGFVVIPALANTPLHYEEPVDSSYKVNNECGFKIIEHDLGTLESTFWFDENGNMSEGHQRWNITSTWSANGKSLEFTWNQPTRGWFVSYHEGYIVFTGSVKITLPGEGVVSWAAGQTTYYLLRDKQGEISIGDVIRETGNYDTNWPAICAYLAP